MTTRQWTQDADFTTDEAPRDIPADRRLRGALHSALSAFAVVATLGVASEAQAQTYPSKPIEVVIPFAPGGGTDSTIRLVESAVARNLGQKIVLNNLPGGHGSRALTQFKAAKPDGYTIAIVPTGPIASLPHMTQVTYTKDDFVPVIQLNNVPNTLVVPPQSEFKSLSDIVVSAKRQPPGALKVAIAGTGSPSSHLPMVDLEKRFGIKFSYVPHKGGGPALIPVMGGHVDLGSVDLAVSGPKLKSGHVRGIGVFASGRSKEFPDLATLKEQGADVEGGFFNMILVPKGTPPDVIRKLHDAFKSALEDPVTLARAKELNLGIEYLNGEDSRKKIDRYFETIGRLVKDLGLDKKN